MKFKLSEQQPVMQQAQQTQQPVQQQVQQVLPVYDPSAGLTIPIGGLQDPNFVNRLNAFFKQNGINFAVPKPKPQPQAQQIQQPMR